MEKGTFIWVEFHLVVRFPLLKYVQVPLKKKSVRVVSNGTVKKTVVSKETDFGARRESFMDVVNVDEKEEGAQDGALGYSR